jgi:hypothetical protein
MTDAHNCLPRANPADCSETLGVRVTHLLGGSPPLRAFIR